MDGPITQEELAELLAQTGSHHHAAFAESDGADPEWALWYAAHLQALLWGRLDRIPTRAELVYLLIGAERAMAESGSTESFPAFYATFILERL